MRDFTAQRANLLRDFERSPFSLASFCALKGLKPEYVAVDLRKASPTFGRWVGERLSAENHKQMWIPPGFAHGFVVTSESAEFLYKTTDYWYPEHERSLRWNDPAIGIDWPIEGQPLLAAKDAAAALLRDAEVFAD